MSHIHVHVLHKLRIKAWVDKESWWSASWYQQSWIGVVWFGFVNSKLILDYGTVRYFISLLFFKGCNYRKNTFLWNTWFWSVNKARHCRQNLFFIGYTGHCRNVGLIPSITCLFSDKWKENIQNTHLMFIYSTLSFCVWECKIRPTIATKAIFSRWVFPSWTEPDVSTSVIYMEQTLQF